MLAVASVAIPVPILLFLLLAGRTLARDSRVKALPVKRSEKGHGDENGALQPHCQALCPLPSPNEQGRQRRESLGMRLPASAMPLFHF